MVENIAQRFFLSFRRVGIQGHAAFSVDFERGCQVVSIRNQWPYVTICEYVYQTVDGGRGACDNCFMNNTNNTGAAVRFHGTFERLRGQKAAVVTLTDSAGRDVSMARIEGHNLYERGFDRLSALADMKGGSLDRYSRTEAPRVVDHFSRPCLSRISPGIERRQANALNVEIGQPIPRCLNKIPEHWTGPAALGLRWVASGGSPLVLGACQPNGCANRCSR